MFMSTEDLRVIAAAMSSFSISANKHPGGSLSANEALTTLFFSGAANLGIEEAAQRDHFVCSKGHAAAPYFFALWAHGFFGQLELDDLVGFGQVDHRIPRMPRRDVASGVEMSTGSLGQGLSFGSGLAIADRKLGRPGRTFVLLGDGECTEGQVWEAAMTAARLGLRNLVAILDANGSGSVIKLDRDEWAARWAGFGWHVFDVDGHDIPQVLDALREAGSTGRPSVLILRTVKGNGLSPAVAGSNTLSSEVADKYRPQVDLHADVARALSLIDAAFPAAARRRASLVQAGRPAPAVPLTYADVHKRLGDSPIGVAKVTKQVGGEIAEALRDLPILMLSPDAIRNSGLLPEMERVGSWHHDNPGSTILQCAIAEQDAASLAAGAAAGGLLSFLFSMEGFYWRMLDQIRESVAFQQVPVVLAGTSGGIGDLLGPMVQSDTLLTALSAISGLEIFEASDANEAKALVAEILSGGRPAYLRLPHEAIAPLRTLDEIAACGMAAGYWVLEDARDPDLVVLTAGALRDAVRAAVERLQHEYGVRTRLLQVFSTTRFAALADADRAIVLPPGVPQISFHNGPSSVLGQFLAPDGRAVGVDSWGISGWPLARLYEAAGLSDAAIFGQLEEMMKPS